MATSGQANGNNVDGLEGSYLAWQLVSQDVASNSSLVNWQVGWRFEATGCRGLRLGVGVVNGVTVYADNDGGDGVHGFVSGHNHRPALQTAGGAIVINHNSDGTKTFGVSVGMTGFSGLRSEGAAAFALPTIPRQPSAPGNPTFSSVGSTTATVSWTAPSNVGAGLSQRQVQIATNSNFSNIIKDSTTSWNTSYNATGLPKGTTLYARVRASSSAGFGPYSEVRSFTTDTTVPSAPGTPTFSSITGSTVSVNWSTPSDSGGATITSYTMQRALNSGFSSGVVTMNGITSRPVQITGLAPATTYFVRVRAVNSAGVSDWSSHDDFTTGAVPPGAPPAPTISNLTPISAQVDYTAPASNGGATITGYDVQRATNSGFTSNVVTVADSATPYIFNGLAPATNYWVRVRAKNSAGAGAYSPSVQFLTPSGVKIGDGVQWKTALARVGDGSTWVIALVKVGDGSAWV